MKCQVCQTENKEGSAFCKNCGNSLPSMEETKFCSNCGAKISAKAAFCPECGSNLKSESNMNSNATWEVGTDFFMPNNANVKPMAEETVIPNPTVQNTARADMNGQSMSVQEKFAENVPERTQYTPPVQDNEGNKKDNKTLFIILGAIAGVILLAVIIVFVVRGLGEGKEKKEEMDTATEQVQNTETTEVEEATDNATEEAEEATENSTGRVPKEPVKHDPNEENDELDSDYLESLDWSRPIVIRGSMRASSELIEKVNHSVSNLQDGDMATAWVEGVDGSGIEESVEFVYSEEQTLFGIAIMPGYLKDSKTFDKNGMPTELTIKANGKRFVVDLSDYDPVFGNYNASMMMIDFEDPIVAEEVTVMISDAVSGTKYSDTCISEMYLYTYLPEYEEGELLFNDYSLEYSADYILPYSDIYLLTESDLEGLTKEECRLARNELYARHGRIFKDETLQEYFDSKDWYFGTIASDDFREDMLNDIEVKNRDFIVEYEKKKGFQ